MFGARVQLDKPTVDRVVPYLKSELANPAGLPSESFEGLDDELLRQMSAAQALARNAPETEGLIEFLTKVLRDEAQGYDQSRLGSLQVFEIVEVLGPKAEPLVATLIEMLPKWVELNAKSEVVGVYHHAAADVFKALGAIGPAAKAAIPTIKRYASVDSMGIDEVKQVSAAARDAIAEIEGGR